jgi:hypothetical protein
MKDLLSISPALEPGPIKRKGRRGIAPASRFSSLNFKTYFLAAFARSKREVSM